VHEAPIGERLERVDRIVDRAVVECRDPLLEDRLDAFFRRDVAVRRNAEQAEGQGE
jgi:hypothetical protein